MRPSLKHLFSLTALYDNTVQYSFHKDGNYDKNKVTTKLLRLELKMPILVSHYKNIKIIIIFLIEKTENILHSFFLWPALSS